MARKTKAIPINVDVLREIERTLPIQSITQRVNELLRIGLQVERANRIDEEISSFFGGGRKDLGRSAFQRASRRVMSRE